jgi:hypothetical protein
MDAPASLTEREVEYFLRQRSLGTGPQSVNMRAIFPDRPR